MGGELGRDRKIVLGPDGGRLYYYYIFSLKRWQTILPYSVRHNVLMACAANLEVEKGAS